MRVNDPALTSSSAYGVGKAQGSGAAAPLSRARGDPEAGVASGDRVEISSTAGLLQVDAALRAEKVEQLRQLVAAGRYVVEPGALARRIIEQSLNIKD